MKNTKDEKIKLICPICGEDWPECGHDSDADPEDRDWKL